MEGQHLAPEKQCYDPVWQPSPACITQMLQGTSSFNLGAQLISLLDT